MQNVAVTFSGVFGKTPVTLNSGNLSGTTTNVPIWVWSGLSGPNPTPGWGVYVSRTGRADVSSGGLLSSGISPIIFQTYYSVGLTITSSGYSCH